MLTIRNNNRAGSARRGGSILQMADAVMTMASDPRVRSMLGQLTSGKSFPASTPTRPLLPSIGQSGLVKNKAKRGKTRKRSSIPKQVQDHSIVCTFKFLTDVTVNDSGIRDNFIGLGVDLNSQYLDLGSSCPQYNSVASVFEYAEYLRFSFCFKPAVSYSTAGSYCISVDPNPDHLAPGSFPITHERSVLSDIKSEAMIIWTPVTQQEREDKFTDSVTTHGGIMRSCSVGTFQQYYSVPSVQSASVGQTVIEFTVRLHQLR